MRRKLQSFSTLAIVVLVADLFLVWIALQASAELWSAAASSSIAVLNVVAGCAAASIRPLIALQPEQVKRLAVTSAATLVAYTIMSLIAAGWFVVEPYLCSPTLVQHSSFLLTPTCSLEGVSQVLVKAAHALVVWACFYTVTLIGRCRRVAT